MKRPPRGPNAEQLKIAGKKLVESNPILQQTQLDWLISTQVPTGGQVLFTPPSSPQFQPIELV